VGAQQVRRSRTLLTSTRRLSPARAAATAPADEPLVLDRVAALLICRWSTAAARRAHWRALVFGIVVGGTIEAAGYPGAPTRKTRTNRGGRSCGGAGAFAGAALDAHPLHSSRGQERSRPAQGIARRGRRVDLDADPPGLPSSPSWLVGQRTPPPPPSAQGRVNPIVRPGRIGEGQGTTLPNELRTGSALRPDAVSGRSTRAASRPPSAAGVDRPNSSPSDSSRTWAAPVSSVIGTTSTGSRSWAAANATRAAVSGLLAISASCILAASSLTHWRRSITVTARLTRRQSRSDSSGARTTRYSCQPTDVTRWAKGHHCLCSRAYSTASQRRVYPRQSAAPRGGPPPDGAASASASARSFRRATQRLSPR
jgi:hypothetical protein